MQGSVINLAAVVAPTYRNKKAPELTEANKTGIEPVTMRQRLRLYLLSYLWGKGTVIRPNPALFYSLYPSMLQR